MGKFIKKLLITIMLKDAIVYVARPLFHKAAWQSMLEVYLVFNGHTPHLYKNGDFNDPKSFRRAESIFILNKYV